jgi:2-(3-amino-3-carboxypropyl)histidine synthase
LSDYDLELDRILQKIKENNYSSVLLQFPEGMLDKPLNKVKEILSKENLKVYVAGDPSYGACDLAVDQAKKLKCDLLVHFGHSEFGFAHQVSSVRKEPVDILLVPAYYIPPQDPDLNRILDEIKKYGWKTIGLAATVQHLKTLEKLEQFLNENLIKTIKNNSGQVIGCNVNIIRKESNKCDGFVSIHAGFFHTHGILLNAEKPLIQFNPYTTELLFYSEEDRKKAIQQRFAILSKAKNASKWGILGSSKLGQFNQSLIIKAQSIFTEHNVDAISVIAENINPHMVTNFSNVDAWVVTACPRIAIDDKIRYSKPIITFKEFLYLFDHLNWDYLLEHGFF